MKPVPLPPSQSLSPTVTSGKSRGTYREQVISSKGGKKRKGQGVIKIRMMTGQVKLTSEREKSLESKSAWQAQVTTLLKQWLLGIQWGGQTELCPFPSPRTSPWWPSFPLLLLHPHPTHSFPSPVSWNPGLSPPDLGTQVRFPQCLAKKIKIVNST